MDEAKKLIVLEQENEELKRELRELFKTLDQMNQSLNRMIDHYILCKTEKAGYDAKKGRAVVLDIL